MQKKNLVLKIKLGKRKEKKKKRNKKKILAIVGMLN